jgi:L-lactate dehydrogenase complex protein LldE
MPAISAKMADDKLRAAQATGALTVTGGDLGCLLSLAGRASRQGMDLEFRHVAELLAGQTDTPAIGEAQ